MLPVKDLDSRFEIHQPAVDHAARTVSQDVEANDDGVFGRVGEEFSPLDLDFGLVAVVGRFLCDGMAGQHRQIEYQDASSLAPFDGLPERALSLGAGPRPALLRGRERRRPSARPLLVPGRGQTLLPGAADLGAPGPDLGRGSAGGLSGLRSNHRRPHPWPMCSAALSLPVWGSLKLTPGNAVASICRPRLVTG